MLVDIFSNLECSSLRNNGFIQQSSLNAMCCMSLSHDKILKNNQKDASFWGNSDGWRITLNLICHACIAQCSFVCVMIFICTVMEAMLCSGWHPFQCALKVNRSGLLPAPCSWRSRCWCKGFFSWEANFSQWMELELELIATTAV